MSPVLAGENAIVDQTQPERRQAHFYHQSRFEPKYLRVGCQIRAMAASIVNGGKGVAAPGAWF
jgi:hypothetical protein